MDGWMDGWMAAIQVIGLYGSRYFTDINHSVLQFGMAMEMACEVVLGEGRLIMMMMMIHFANTITLINIRL